VPFTNEEVRRDLLGGLYRRAVERPEARWVSRDVLLKALKISDDVLTPAVSELRGKGLVDTDGEPWERVAISEKGMRDLDIRELSFCPHL
jgi:hypothetical protein